MYFTFTGPGNVLFGAGSSEQIGEKALELNCDRLFCMYDPGVKEAGIVDPIIENLEDAGVDVVEFGDIEPDPPVSMIEKTAAMANEEMVDGVLGIGGGSTMDAAKCVNILLTNPGPIVQYVGHGLVPNPGKTLILIPTTSGTGSEVSCAAVLSDSESGRKLPVAGDKVIADLAIIDPSLTLGLPPNLTAATGMDAFTHAVESFTTNNTNPLSETLSERAINIIYKNLPLVVDNGSDLTARTNMSLGCMMGALALNDALLQVGHAIGHSMGAHWHIHHGIACGIALPLAIEYNAEKISGKLSPIADALGISLQGASSPMEKAKIIADDFRAFYKKLGLPTLKELNVDQTRIDAVAEDSLQDIMAMFTPKRLTKEAVKDFLESCF